MKRIDRRHAAGNAARHARRDDRVRRRWRCCSAWCRLTGIYPYFVMQALCFALFACAFNLLIGYGGLLSFGHAMFLGTAGYVHARMR